METTAAHIAALIRHIAIAHRAKANAWIADSDLTPEQAFALGYVIENHEDGVIARDLADVTRTKPASVASLVKGMESRGIVTRAPSPRDSRVKLLHPTKKGEELYQDFQNDLKRADEEVFGVLPKEDQDTLVKLLNQLQNNL